MNDWLIDSLVDSFARGLGWAPRSLIGAMLGLCALGCTGVTERPTPTADSQQAVAAASDARARFAPLAEPTGLFPVQDTSVRPGRLADRNFGAAPELLVNQSLIAFDQAALTDLVAGNREVAAATLEMQLTGAPPRGPARSVDVLRLSHDWSELSATWNCADDRRPSDGRENCARSDSWAMDGVLVRRSPWATPATATAVLPGEAPAVLDFDVTADVRGFLAGTWPNFGWILRSDQLATDTVVRFGSRESGSPPQLMIATRCRDAYADCDQDPANGCEALVGPGGACGVCEGACDDGNPCTADSCAATGCVHDPVADGTGCSDGNACTQADSCQVGVCVAGTPVTCAVADACHAAGVCDPATGACASAPLTDGTGCSDGSACTEGDRCVAGACVAGTPVTCAVADACHAAGVCDPATGACASAPLADGAPCSDGNGCTDGDRCVAGACVAGAPVVCASNDGCHPGVCDPQSGACSNPPACQLYGVGSLSGTASDGLAVTPARLEDGTSNNQVGGIGSAIAYTGVGNLFVSTPDRGPGGGADSYGERYYLLDVSLADGRVTPLIRGAALLDQGAGLDTFIGLASAFDAGGSAAGRRFDAEGVRVGRDGTFFVSDEYGPFIYEFGADGHRRRALPVPDKFLIAHPGIDDAELPPANTKGRQANRGMEGLAISPDGAKLYGIMQSPLIQDGALSPSNDRIGTNVRILEIDVASGATRELLYPLDSPAYGINEILAVSDHQFLVLERDGRGGAAAVAKRLFLIDIAGASDISDVAALPVTGVPAGVTAVGKRLFLDLLDPAFALAGASFPEKIEGLSFGPDLPDGRHVLLVTSDNDFIPTQASQIYAFAIDPRALPGWQPQRVTFPTQCADSTPASCPAAGACQPAGTCNPGDGTCSQPVAPAGTPAGIQAAGDCRRSQCDGAGQVVSVPDDADVDVDADPCTADACSNGQALHVPVAVGTSCSADGSNVCDGAGQCVPCAGDGCPSGGNAPPTFRVLRVGDGATALSSAAAAVFIEERSLDGVLVATVALPVASSGNNLPFTSSGSATSEGGLSLSADGHSLALAGYAAVPGTAAIASTTSAAVNRVVARIDALGNIDTSTALPAAFSANNVRGAASVDGTGFWVAGAGGATGGIWFIPLGARLGVQVAGNPASVRWPLILSGPLGGQLYASASSGAFVNVFTVGTGLPQVGPQTNVPLPGMPTTGASSPFSFVLLDLDPVTAGPDTLYVADDRAATAGGGVQKWTSTSTSTSTSTGGAIWTLAATLNVAATPIGFRGLAGAVVGGRPTLMATTADASPRLVVFVDDGGSAVTGTVVATSPANTAFRGVALSPR